MNPLGFTVRLVLSAALAAGLVALVLYAGAAWLADRLKPERGDGLLEAAQHQRPDRLGLRDMG